MNASLNYQGCLVTAIKQPCPENFAEVASSVVLPNNDQIAISELTEYLRMDVIV